MTRFRVLMFMLVSLVGASAAAQLSDANQRGVAMGHLHYFVTDVAKTAAFWETLGGKRAAFGAGELAVFPGVIVLISPGEQRADSGEAVIGHMAFRVASVAAIEARGIDVEYNEQFPGVAYVRTPDGERVELFDDGIATNIGFEPEAGRATPVSLRHNRALEQPIVTHHMHFYVPEGEVEAARAWYVENFGAVPGIRWRYEAADLPGINLNFSPVPAAREPTSGRMLDHIGFEIEGLEAFVQALESRGIEFDVPYRKLPNGLGLAFLTDPWGTYIELTEGLAAVAAQ